MLLVFSRIKAVDSRMYGFVRSTVRRRFVCWNNWGIDASTAEEEKHSRRRINIKGDEEEKIEDIVFASQQPSFVLHTKMSRKEPFVPQLQLKCDTY